MSTIFSVKLPYKTRCNLPDCRKPVQQVFRTNIDDFNLTFCSPDHARLGEQRWEEKKKLNVRIGVPSEKEEQMTGDNLLDLEGEVS